jgi:serine protease inhibitor
LGVSKAFDENAADFSAITDDVRPFISAIKQETFITIDEVGVEAAAYTKVDMSVTSIIIPENRIEMTLNRPFIYCVTSQNGMPLFIGICMEVA